jgi:hypothetical protein
VLTAVPVRNVVRHEDGRTPFLTRGRRRRPDDRAGVELTGRPQRGRLVGDPLEQGGVLRTALPLPHLDLLGRRLAGSTQNGEAAGVGRGRAARRESEHGERREGTGTGLPEHPAPLGEGDGQ